MTKLEYVMVEKLTVKQIVENIGLLSEADTPEHAEMFSCVICNLSTTLEQLHKCIDPSPK